MNRYEFAAIALFPCLLGLKGTIIKYFLNCLLMNLKDYPQNGKNDGLTFYPFLAPHWLGVIYYLLVPVFPVWGSRCVCWRNKSLRILSLSSLSLTRDTFSCPLPTANVPPLPSFLLFTETSRKIYTAGWATAWVQRENIHLNTKF